MRYFTIKIPVWVVSVILIISVFITYFITTTKITHAQSIDYHPGKYQLIVNGNSCYIEYNTETGNAIDCGTSVSYINNGNQ